MIESKIGPSETKLSQCLLPLFCSGIEIIYIDHCLDYVSKCYLGISICNAKQRLHRLPYLHSWYESNHILLGISRVVLTFKGAGKRDGVMKGLLKVFLSFLKHYLS